MDDRDSDSFSLDDLSEITGYDRRVIRSFIEQGLMRGASSMGRYAHYSSYHLYRLMAIKVLRDTKGMSLAAIRTALVTMSEDELRALVARSSELHFDLPAVSTDAPWRGPQSIDLDSPGDSARRDSKNLGTRGDGNKLSKKSPKSLSVPSSALDYLKTLQTPSSVPLKEMQRITFGGDISEVNELFPNRAKRELPNARKIYEDESEEIEELDQAGSLRAQSIDQPSLSAARELHQPKSLQAGESQAAGVPNTLDQRVVGLQQSIDPLNRAEKFGEKQAENDNELEQRESEQRITGQTPIDLLLRELARIHDQKHVRRQSKGDSWYRISITPDIELSVRGIDDAEQLSRLERLADYLREILLGVHYE